MTREPTLSPVDAKALASVDRAAQVIRGLLSPEQGTPEPEDTEAEVEVTPTSPDAPDETEAQAEVEPALDAEPTPEGTEPQPEVRSRKLTIDGQEVEVTEDEAYLGYLRQRDYTQKTQQAAEARKKAEAAERAAGEARQQNIVELEQVKQAMQALVPVDPDWDVLRTKMTPEQFAAAHAEYTTFKRQYDAVVARQKQLQTEQQEAAEKHLETYREEQGRKLLEAIPEWHDDTVRKADKAKIKEYAKGVLGLTDDEIANVSDARVVLGLRNAMLWHEVQQQGATVTPTKKPKLKPASPGTTPAPVKPKDEKSRAFDRQRKSGKLEDTAKVFEHLI